MTQTNREIPKAQEGGAVEDEEMLMDHEYDGIREYDNPLPGWWVWTFWGTFFFSIAYMVHYQWTGNGPSVVQAYQADMAEFRQQLAMQDMGGDVTEEGLAKLMKDTVMMKDAEAVYQLRCAQCHGAQGEGKIGPNLTDDSWLHGKGTLLDIYATVNEGVLTKGMPAWGRQLQPMELRTVVAFVGTVRNTNRPGKPPEGTKVAVDALAPDTDPANEASSNEAAGAAGAAGAAADSPNKKTLEEFGHGGAPAAPASAVPEKGAVPASAGGSAVQPTKGASEQSEDVR